MPDLTISLVTANNKKLIVDCLRSIYDNTRDLDFETYVVLNASTDDSREELEQNFPQVKLIINDEKLGFTHNHNMVMREGNGRYFLVLNDDTVILNDALKRMVEYMDDDKDAGILGCKIYNHDMTPQWSCGKAFSHKFEYFRSGVIRPILPFLPEQHIKVKKDVSWVTGACLMARAEAMEEVGLFDENIIIYYEDGDWCYRMNKAGWKVVFNPESEIIHYHGQTRKHNMARDLYIIFQSKLYFYTKHYSKPTQFLVRFLMIIEIVLRYSKASLLSLFCHKNKEKVKELTETYKQGILMALNLNHSMSEEYSISETSKNSSNAS